MRRGMGAIRQLPVDAGAMPVALKAAVRPITRDSRPVARDEHTPAISHAVVEVAHVCNAVHPSLDAVTLYLTVMKRPFERRF